MTVNAVSNSGDERESGSPGTGLGRMKNPEMVPGRGRLDVERLEQKA